MGKEYLDLSHKKRIQELVDENGKGREALKWLIMRRLKMQWALIMKCTISTSDTSARTLHLTPLGP